MGSVDDLIKRIASSKLGLTVEEIAKMIEDKKRSYYGLLTDEGAAHLVAQDLGVQLNYSGNGQVKLKDLVSGLRDVSLEASIAHIGQPKEFRRKGGVGRVLRLIIDDGTKQIPCVLWDNRVNEFLSANPSVGWRVRVLHGYTRTGIGGVELHVGSRGSIEAEEAGETKVSTMKISNLTVQDRAFILEAFVLFKSSLKTFKSKTGEGKVLRLRIRDETGVSTLVLWNEAADKVADVEEGRRIRVLGGKVRLRKTGDLEVHINSPDMVELLSSKVGIEELAFKVAELKPNMRGLTMLLRAYSKPFTRFFRTPQGAQGKVSSILCGDETGLITVNLWANASSRAESVRSNDLLLVKNAYTRMGLRGLEVHLGSNGVLEVNPNLPAPKQLNLKRGIENLKEGDRYVTIEGIVLTNPEARTVSTTRGDVKVASFILGDETGSMRVSVWRSLADKAERFEAGAVVRLTHLYVRRGLSGELEASTTRFSEIILIEEAE